MRELAPTIWITGLREVQNPNRAGLDIVSADGNFGSLKISPVFRWTDRDMHAYCEEHGLPNEWDYFDPAKAEHFILPSHLDEMSQSFLEFFGAVTCASDEGNTDPNVGV